MQYSSIRNDSMVWVNLYKSCFFSEIVHCVIKLQATGDILPDFIVLLVLLGTVFIKINFSSEVINIEICTLYSIASSNLVKALVTFYPSLFTGTISERAHCYQIARNYRYIFYLILQCYYRYRYLVFIKI